MESFRFQPGETPVLLSIPHVGTAVPDDIAATMTEEALALPDTDRHLDRLCHFAPALGLGFLKATLSRYVIDLNRDPAGASCYPGADDTELCPTTSFDLMPIYRPGLEPDAAEIERRTGAYWRPYHEQLRDELESLRDRFGVAVLFDLHSIRSHVPRFFDGPLPDLNLGTGDGTTASPHLVGRLMCVLTTTERYSSVLNGHFTGGYTTRHYGRPDDGIHALHLEMSQGIYMEEESPFRFRPEGADELRPTLERMLGTVVQWAWSQTTMRKRVAHR